MKIIKPILALIFSLGFMHSAIAVDIYECYDEQEKERIFQNKTCKSGQLVKIHSYDVSDKDPTDALRPFEYTMLSRFHEMDMERLRSNLELAKDFRLAQQQFENASAFEKLRHEQAKEMFDKHYRHFWAYSYSNGDGGNPFTFGPSSDTIITPAIPMPAPVPIATPPATPSPGPTVPGTAP